MFTNHRNILKEVLSNKEKIVKQSERKTQIQRAQEIMIIHDKLFK